MFLKSLHVDRFRGKSNWRFDGLRSGVEVFYGPAGSGKRTLTQFVRAMLFGFDDSARHDFHGPGAARLGGELTLQSGHFSEAVRRYEDGTVDGRLSIESVDGNVSGQARLDELTCGLSVEQLDHLCVVDFSRRPVVDELVGQARAFGLTFGGVEVARVAELRDRVTRLQREFNSLPAGSQTLDELSERHAVISAEIHSLERQTSRASRNGERQRLVEARDRVEERLAEARHQLQQLHEERESLLRRKRGLTAPESSGPAPQDDLLPHVDQRIEQWRQLLSEIADNKRSLQDDLARHDGVVAQAANPRKPLKELEQRFGKLETRLNELDHGQCVCRPLQTELRHAVTEIRQELYSVCDELGRWESAQEYRAYAHQLQHLNRCEHELQSMVQSLLDGRSAVQESRSERWCQCDAHPAAARRPQQHSQYDPQLDVELSKLAQRHEEAETQIQHLQTEFASLSRQLDGESTFSEQRLVEMLAGKKQELKTLRAAMHSAERRQEIAAEVAELKLEIKDLQRHHSNGSIADSASRLLRVFSGGNLTRVELDAQDHVWVVERGSRKRAWQELGAGGRAQTYLAVLLALRPLLARAGVRLPLLLKDAFTHFEAENVVAAAKVIREAAGMRQGLEQVLIVTAHQHVAEVFRHLHASVHSLDDDRPSNQADASQDVGSQETRDWPRRRQVEFQLTEDSPIEDAPSISAAHANQFRKIGVSTVGQLLTVVPGEAAMELGYAGVTDHQIRTWQAQARLMCRVPHLRAYDARILVACDVTDPRELRAISPRRLRDIVQRFAESRSGRALLMSGTEFELSRVTDWMSPRESEAQDDDQLSRRLERSAQRKSRESRDRSERSSGGTRNGERRKQRHDGDDDDRQRRRERRAERVLKMQQDSDWKFYLNADDAIVDAPSIGPRTASRLEGIGIATVRDLLTADGEEVAEQLGQKRINAELVERWQQQASLATRIPQLRGHDAQILVALGVVEPQALAELDPDELWAKVEPFVRTNQGKRIIRNGKKPDLEEVASWIQFAAAARPLQAA